MKLEMIKMVRSVVIYGQFELGAKDLFLRPYSRIGVRRGNITRATGGVT